MKKNNKILNKIITGFLAFAMVLTGAMSLGTMKKHTASADTTIEAQPFDVDHVYEFAEAMGLHMRLEGLPSVLLVDSQLFLDATVSRDMDVVELYNTAFLRGLVAGLYEQLVGVQPGEPDYTVQEVLGWAELEIIINLYDTNNYINIISGERFTASTPTLFFNRSGYNINNNPFYAAILNLPNSRFYNMLCDLQAQKLFSIYIFPSVDIVLSDDGVLFAGVWLGGRSFTEGVYWSE